MEKFIVEISARHIHVTKEQVAILFGEGHTLTPKRLFLSRVSSPAKKS